MDYNESSKTCTVCGVPNDIANRQCINCNSYLLEGLQSENNTIDKEAIDSGKLMSIDPDLVYSYKLPPIQTKNTAKSQNDISPFPQTKWFRWLLLGFIILIYYSGSLKTVADWMLLIFIISSSSLIAGMINPGLISKNNATRSAILRTALPIILLSFVLFGVTLQGSTPTFSSTKPVPSISYDSSVEKVSKDFEWKYDGRTFNWHVEASQELLEYDRNLNVQISTFFQSNGNTQHDIFSSSSVDFRKMIQSISENGEHDFNIWVNEESNSQWVAKLADQLNQSAQENDYDYFQKAEFILSFVGSAIPYQLTEYPQLPAQTVFDNGDCMDKSILLAAMLGHLDYRVALLIFAGTSTKPGHMAVGVALDDSQIPETRVVNFYEYQGYKYYFAETTSPNWPLGKASIEKPADIIEID